MNFKKIASFMLAFVILLGISEVFDVPFTFESEASSGINYTVTFNLNGAPGTPPASQSVAAGTKARTPTAPRRDGYVFGGWCKEPESVNLWNFSTENVTSNVTLYAYWKETYTITFNRNGVTGSDIATQQRAIGERITKPADPTGTGYIFAGWFREAACTNEWNFSTTITGNTTLYAKWVTAYTASFNLNYTNAPANQVPVSQNLAAGSKLRKPSDPKRDGFVFGGWHTEPQCTYEWKFSTDSIGNSNVILYAKWITSYEVKFDLNYNHATNVRPPNPIIAATGTVIRKPGDPRRDGYTFAGWCRDASGTIVWNFADDKVMGDMTLYAQWRLNDPIIVAPVISYDVSFNLNYTGAGTPPPVQSIVSGNRARKPSDPKRDGYIFSGWFWEANCINEWSFNNAITGNITLYAKWVVAYEVTFNLNYNHATNVRPPAAVTAASGTTIRKPGDPRREGYVFAGWFREANCVTEWVFATNTVTANTTLYAKWTDTYTVNFLLSGGAGNPPATQYILPGGTVRKPSDPKSTGMVFEGWVTNPSNTTLYNFNNVVTGDMTLYAKWSGAVWVYFNLNGGTGTPPASQYGSVGERVKKPSDPKRDRFEFTGWYTEASCVNLWNMNNSVTANMTLYAGWKPMNTVTFNGNGSTSPMPETQHIATGGKATRPPLEPSRTGFSFKGWFKEAACTNEWDFSRDTVNGNVILYAKWVETFTISYNLNGASGQNPASIQVARGDLVGKPVEPRREGYILLGWYTDASGNNEWDFDTEKATSNMTLYAKWARAFNVNFNTNGGMGVAPTSQLIAEGSSAIRPGDPRRDGYAFAGWFKQVAATDAWSFRNDTVSTHTTLYAGWAQSLTPNPLVDQLSNIIAAADKNNGSSLNIKMGDYTSMPRNVASAIAGKDVNLNLDFGDYILAVNGKNITTTNRDLNLYVQISSSTSHLIVSVPKNVLDTRAKNHPTIQFIINSDVAAVAKSITITSPGGNYSGQVAVSTTYSSSGFTARSAANIPSNGNITLSFTGAGDYIAFIYKAGNVLGTGTVSTDDAIAILRDIAGLESFDSIQKYVSSVNRDGVVDVGDALYVLRVVAGLSR